MKINLTKFISELFQDTLIIYASMDDCYNLPVIEEYQKKKKRKV